MEVFLKDKINLDQKTALYIAEQLEKNIKYNSATGELIVQGLDSHNSNMLTASAIHSLSGANYSLIGKGEVHYSGNEAQKAGKELTENGINFHGSTHFAAKAKS